MLLDKLASLPTGPAGINDTTLVGLILGLLLVIISAVGLAIRASLALRAQERQHPRPPSRQR
jgi:F0F1-type ATP synthase assembly protein I